MLILSVVLPLYLGHPVLGYIIPAAIFALSFWIAWSLFKYFNRK